MGLEMGNGGSRTADDLVEGPNDVNFCVCAPKEEDTQLFGQPLRGRALGIETALAIVAGAPVLHGMPCMGLASGVLGEVSCELHAMRWVLLPAVVGGHGVSRGG